MFTIRAASSEVVYHRGDLVEVHNLEEILGTLDGDGKLDGILFMPEMARSCGCRFRVCRRAEKICVEGAGLRRLGGAVFLDGLRCDGAMHDGCQRGCLYLWKEAWLKPVVSDASIPPALEDPESRSAGLDSNRNVLAAALPTTKGDRYYCQSTELLTATSEFPRWNLRHYLRDLRDGEVSLPRLVRILWRVGTNKIRRLLGLGQLGLVLGRQVNPPKGDLNLQAGEWVEVKSRAEILTTLDATGHNRGLSFETEMFDHCGRRYQVAYPVCRIILEETGKMVELASTVILDGVTCRGLCVKNCPRNNFFYWRESWLRRV